MSGAIKAVTGVFKNLFTPAKPVSAGASAPMPDPDNPVAKLNARRKAKERAKSGREGTIYSSGAYGNANLGGTA